MKSNTKKRSLVMFLLVLCLAIGVALVGTLARYMTSRTVSDEGRAAKFGLNIPNTFDLFKETYTNVDSDTDGQKVIAPGTQGKYDFVVSGTSEVTYKVEASATIEYAEVWGDYEPLKFSLDGNVWMSLTELNAALATALNSEVMQPNSVYSGAQTIYWQWPFHVSPEYDIKDTAIGAAAAAGQSPTVTMTLTVLAAQVD